MLPTLLLGSKIGLWNCQNCMSMNFFSNAVQILKESLIKNKQIFYNKKHALEYFSCYFKINRDTKMLCI